MNGAHVGRARAALYYYSKLEAGFPNNSNRPRRAIRSIKSPPLSSTRLFRHRKEARKKGRKQGWKEGRKEGFERQKRRPRRLTNFYASVY